MPHILELLKSKALDDDLALSTAACGTAEAEAVSWDGAESHFSGTCELGGQVGMYGQTLAVHFSAACCIDTNFRNQIANSHFLFSEISLPES